MPNERIVVALMKGLGLVFLIAGLGSLVALAFPGVRDGLSHVVTRADGRPAEHPLAVAVMIGSALVGVGLFVIDLSRRLGNADVRADGSGLHIQNFYGREDLSWDEIGSFFTDRLTGRSSPYMVRTRDGRTFRLDALGSGPAGSRRLAELQAELDRRRRTG